jgi:hypothetical protein
MAGLALLLMGAPFSQASKFSATVTRQPLSLRVQDNAGLQQTSLADIQRLLSAIRPGMRRAEVEQLMLEPDEGIQPERGTRYKWGPGFVILVPFDQDSGLWEPQNKVNGLPKLTLQ